MSDNALITGITILVAIAVIGVSLFGVFAIIQAFTGVETMWNVTVREVVEWTTTVEAENEQEAREKGYQLMTEDGTNPDAYYEMNAKEVKLVPTLDSGGIASIGAQGTNSLLKGSVMSKVSEILVEAKSLISDPKYWIKGAAYDGDSYCAIGALREICLGSDLYWSARAFLTRSIPDGHLSSIVYFNDNSKTTHRDIMNLFDRAIEASKG